MNSKKEQLTVFPDTNVLLHYPLVDQIDWLKWCNCKSIKIILCLKVINELDCKKNDPNLRERAKKVIKKIKKIIDSNNGHIKDETLLEIYNKDLNHADISVDEAIVQQALDYQSTHHDENLYIMTEDLGMQLRCRQRIQTIEPDKGKRLQSPQSKLHKENINLKNQIAKLQNQIPVLDLIFTHTDEDIESHDIPFRINEFRTVKFLDRSFVLQEEIDRCGKIPIHTLTLAANNSIKKELSHYFKDTTEFQKYISELSKWIEKYNRFMEELSRSFDFNLHIKNTVGVPAENVVVFLKFPKIFQFIVCENEHYGKSPKIPDKPEPPKLELAGTMGLDSLRKVNLYSNFVIPTPNIHGPWVEFREDNDNIFMEITIKKIKHYLVESFECTAGLLSFEHARTFDLEYIVMADNMPQKIEGKIPFIFGQR